MDRYEEALEKAKQGKPIEEIFPQLKESKDERIRKEIVKFITEYKSISPIGSPNHFDEMLIWLDKQKEQPKEELVYRLNGLMQEYIKEGKDDEEKEHRLKCYQLFLDALEDTEFFKRKKAEKNALEKEIKLYFDTYGNKSTGAFDYMPYPKFKDIVETLVSEYGIEQKPTEWNEEDERMVRFYENDYDNNLGNMPMRDIIENRIKFKDWLINRLKSIRPQPHLVRALTDNEMERQLCDLQDKYPDTSWEYGIIGEAIEYIRQSHWKPSEEQMKALEECGECKRCIKELYEQLKKLM